MDTPSEDRSLFLSVSKTKSRKCSQTEKETAHSIACSILFFLYVFVMIGQFLPRVFRVCVPLMLLRRRGGKSPGTTVGGHYKGRAIPLILGELPLKLPLAASARSGNAPCMGARGTIALH